MTTDVDPSRAVTTKERTSRGNPLWVKGFSPNPSGRPKKIPTAQEVFERKVKQDLKSAARDYSAEALQTLIDIMRDKECAPQYRLTAASTILDRGHGKAVNQTEISVGIYDKLSDSELVKFINEKFDLAELRKVGLIKTLTDYTEINNSICNYFGLRSIFEYKEPNISIAFSAGKRAKSNCSLNNWIYLAEQKCIELRNPNIYNRENLIEYFPSIRWQSMDVENGLVKVIKQLFNIGITVVIVPSFPSVHVRGATFTINDKPCIALTDYVGFYPTLWFGLIHELYHVLFDWEDIKNSDPHISEELGLDSISPLEKAADDFAREYLFSKSKTIESSSFINNDNLVRSYALNNNIDPSFVYVFNAYDAPKTDKYAWGRAKKHNPDIKKLKSKLQHDFENGTSFSDHIKKIRNTIYS
jgi:Zn-dependent peptidase ImmA (M78 family)